MVASPRCLRVEPAMKGVVEDWLQVEATGEYVLVWDSTSLEIDFSSIDDAFRFRLQFDQELIA